MKRREFLQIAAPALVAPTIGCNRTPGSYDVDTDPYRKSNTHLFNLNNERYGLPKTSLVMTTKKDKEPNHFLLFNAPDQDVVLECNANDRPVNGTLYVNRALLAAYNVKSATRGGDIVLSFAPRDDKIPACNYSITLKGQAAPGKTRGGIICVSDFEINRKFTANKSTTKNATLGAEDIGDFLTNLHVPKSDSYVPVGASAQQTASDLIGKALKQPQSAAALR